MNHIHITQSVDDCIHKTDGYYSCFDSEYPGSKSVLACMKVVISPLIMVYR